MDKIDLKKLSAELGCQAVEISALKGEGTEAAAKAAVAAAKATKAAELPHVFTGSVEHAIAHIEESIQGKVDAVSYTHLDVYKRQPHLLYYWRSSPASVASNISAKTYCLEAAMKLSLIHIYPAAGFAHNNMEVQFCSKTGNSNAETSSSPISGRAPARNSTVTARRAFFRMTWAIITLRP